MKTVQQKIGKAEWLMARRDVEVGDVILLGEVGSTAHGISVSDQDDLDMTAIRVEDWHEFVNGPEKRASMQIRTQGEGVRSRVGDVDLNVYTLRKFAHLATKLNPSILNMFYLPDPLIDKQPELFKKMLGYVISKQAGPRFLGYMKQQKERWQGIRGQKNVTRPELMEAYGFDTKYAGHLIRLGIQGTQFLNEGVIRIPMDEKDASVIRAVRTGEYSEDEALKMVAVTEYRLTRALEVSPLPKQPNRGGVQNLLDEWYKGHYGFSRED